MEKRGRDGEAHLSTLSQLKKYYVSTQVARSLMIANSWRSEEPSGRKEAHASELVDRKYLAKWKEMLLESIKKDK